MTRWLASLLVASLSAAPLAARDSVGIFGDWGAFRDPDIPRCYAIAQAEGGSGYASVGTWPLRKVRGQFHARLSSSAPKGGSAVLRIGSRTFSLVIRGNNAWSRDPKADAAIVAAMRSANSMTVSFRDTSGKRVRDSYRLPGVATALDAATVACARR